MKQSGVLTGFKFFIDYLLTIVLTLVGLSIFSFALNSAIGGAIYSTVFCLILFAMIYSRAWNTAHRDLKPTSDTEPYWYKGAVMSIPLLAFNLLLVLFFTLVYYNIIPLRDVVVSTSYTFPENEPRQLLTTTFLDVLTPIMRIYSGFLIGFMGGETSPLLLFAGQLIVPAAAFFGYFAGRRRYYLSESIAKTGKKVKDKFNE